MIYLDFYYSGKASSKVNRRVTFAELCHLMEQQTIATIIDKVRAGDKSDKASLPCVCFMGRSRTGLRKAEDMEPTGLVMIDIDHCESPRESFDSITKSLVDAQAKNTAFPKLVLAHTTVSGHGLRLVFTNYAEPKTIEKSILDLDKDLSLSLYGEVDTACKDLTRVSFLVPYSEVLYFFDDFWKGPAPEPTIIYDAVSEEPKKESPKGRVIEKLYKDFRYGNMLVSDIAEEYCKYYFPEGNHRPPMGSVHTFYNQMVKDFRCICDNKPEILISVLPQFGHTDDECFSQCKSICSRNNLSKLPKPFYFFLKDRGWYVNPYQKDDRTNVEEEPEEPFKQLDSLIDSMPKLPPVFRPFINSAPRYFKIPYLMSLLPIMGTLTSYLEGRYNGKTQTTSFMTVIYAPPSSGKSYLVDLAEVLLNKLADRDMVSAARDNIYARIVKMKGANEKSPDDPRTPQRIMPAINSIPKILSKMNNNSGYHMFTAVEEMDTWIKGSKGRDGDKNDMYRIAWDNGKYGQSFMSAQTFNGIVRLYWNVLITGTIDQITNYFKNIENGLITRCSFCDLGDQSFTMAPQFKPINKKDQEAIEKWKDRCDANTYLQPLNVDTTTLYDVSDKDFDEKVPWKMEFRPRQEVNIDWIIPHLDKWCIDQNLLASKTFDNARGIFHRRVAVRGYRLAMICTSLYNRIGEKEKSVIVDFVNWFMDCDIYGILKLFGQKYNDHYVKSTAEIKEYRFADIFDALPQVFETKDLIELLSKSKFNSNHFTVLSIWKKSKLIVKIDKNKFKKL